MVEFCPTVCAGQLVPIATGHSGTREINVENQRGFEDRYLAEEYPTVEGQDLNNFAVLGAYLRSSRCGAFKGKHRGIISLLDEIDVSQEVEDLLRRRGYVDGFRELDHKLELYLDT